VNALIAFLLTAKPVYDPKNRRIRKAIDSMKMPAVKSGLIE